MKARTGSRRACLGLLFRWSLLVTVPAALFFVHWLATLWPRVADFRLRYDLRPYDFGFLTEGPAHARQMLRELRLGVLSQRTAPQLPVVELLVPDAHLKSLDGNLPHSGFAAVNGVLRHRERDLEVSVRYRGDFHHHWAYAKKSWRVRVKKQQARDGLHTFNLLSPKHPSQVNDALGYRLAEQLGVLTPRSELVVLYLNGRPRGVHLLVDQLSATTLTDRGRLPGDIYVGELVAKDAFAGVSTKVFEHPGLWTKASASERTLVEAREPLEKLCRLLARPIDEDLHRELEELLDVAAFARFCAASTLLQSLHHDESHNWRLYFDPVRGRFEPILWDPNAWGSLTLEDDPTLLDLEVSLDPAPSRLHGLLLGNAKFLRARHQALASFLTSDRAIAFLSEVADTVRRARRTVAGDAFLQPPDPDRVLATLDLLPAHIAAVFARVRRAFVEQRQPARWDGDPDTGLRLQVGDRTPVVGVVLTFRRPQPASARLEATLQSSLGARSWLLPTTFGRRGHELRAAVDLSSQYLPHPLVQIGHLRTFVRDVVPTTLQLRLLGGSAGAELLDVAVVEASGTEHGAERTPDLGGPPVDLLWGLSGVLGAAAEQWSGNIEVAGRREVAGDLRILPGSRVRMGTGATLLVRGRLHADGTERQPILFQGTSDGDFAWGSVVLHGPGADGSLLRHCVFTGGVGSVAVDGAFDWPAVLTVVDAAGVVLHDCTFTGPGGAQGQLLAAYSALRLSDCRFHGALASGASLAFASAEVSGSTFGDCGTGIAVRGGEAVLTDCRLQNCRAAGLHLFDGGGSIAVGTTFEHCSRGASVTSGSALALANCTLAACLRPLLTRRAAVERATPARILGHRLRVLDHGLAVRADREGRILLRDCFLSPLPDDPQVALLGCDDADRQRAHLPPESLPLVLHRLAAQAAAAWQAASPGTRGAAQSPR